MTEPVQTPQVVTLCADLFFTSRIEVAALRLGARPLSARSVVELAEWLAQLGPTLVLIDLGTPGLDIPAAVAAGLIPKWGVLTRSSSSLASLSRPC